MIVKAFGIEERPSLPIHVVMSHSHCEDESHDHSHSPPPDSVPGDSLYSKIYLERVRCLNERVEGMARSVIKPWDLRLDTDKVVLRCVFVLTPRFLKAMQTNRCLSLSRIFSVLSTLMIVSLVKSSLNQFFYGLLMIQQLQRRLKCKVLIVAQFIS